MTDRIINQGRAMAGGILVRRCLYRTAGLAAGILIFPAATITLAATGSPTSQPASEVRSNDAPTTRPVPAGPPLDAARAGGHSDDLTSLSLEDLMSVQVTSVSKKKQSIADAPAAVTVISQDDIARSGFDTIPDLLRLTPGMDVARINSSTWAISARGLNDQFADDLLVLQDGRSLYTPLFAGVYWDTVDYILPDLDRIEVIRGPGATLWGANAVNGVINITSKDAQDTQGWLFDSRGSNDDSNLSLRYGGKLSDDTYYRVYTKGAYNNDLEASDGSGAGDSWYSVRDGFRIDKHASDDDTFTLQGDLGSNRVRTPAEEPAFTPPFETRQTFGRTDTTGNMLGRWTHRTGDDSEFSLQVYYDYLGLHGGATEYDQHTADIDFHHRFQIGNRNEISWGLGYRAVNGTFSQTDTVKLSPSTRTDSLYSAFVQDTVTLQPHRWFFTAGSKFEHNDYTGFEVEPSARLLWTPNEQNSVWAAVSRAVKTPSRGEADLTLVASRFQVPTGTGATVPAESLLLGNPEMKSETLVAYELGYRLQPAKTVSIDLSTFYNSYGDLLSSAVGAPQPGLPVIVPITIGNKIAGDTYGGEIATTVQVTDTWRLAGSYSLLEANFHPRSGSSDTLGARNLDGSAPESQAQVHSYLDLTRNLQFNAGLYYIGRVNEFKIPAYVATDLNLVWHPKEGLALKVGMLNLFDSHRKEYGVTESQGLASQVPLTIYGELSYKF
jgi:iron complex outermembrane receptor protein